MSVFVVPDFHGNWRLALGLLEQEELIMYDEDDNPRRLDKETLVVQLGDAANCVRGSISDDIASLRLIGTIIDVMLIGNHEHPYFGGPAFDGFAHYYELQHTLQNLNNRGLIQAAIEVDGILLTHAGVGSSADQIDNWEQDNKAEEFADALNQLWRRKEYHHSMFAAISQYRGGRMPEGGVLWADWKEPKTSQFPQIVGHSVDQSWRAHYGSPGFLMSRPYNGATPVETRTLCIDVGAGKKSRRILGCWITDGKVEIVEYNEDQPA